MTSWAGLSHHVIEEPIDNYDIGLWGFDINFLIRTLGGGGREVLID